MTWEPTRAGQVLSLPTYPFQRTRFWPEQTVPAGSATAAPSPEPADFTFAHSWRQDPARGTPAAALVLPGPARRLRRPRRRGHRPRRPGRRLPGPPCWRWSPATARRAVRAAA